MISSSDRLCSEKCEEQDKNNTRLTMIPLANCLQTSITFSSTLNFNKLTYSTKP